MRGTQGQRSQQQRTSGSQRQIPANSIAGCRVLIEVRVTNLTRRFAAGIDPVAHVVCSSTYPVVQGRPCIKWANSLSYLIRSRDECQSTWANAEFCGFGRNRAVVLMLDIYKPYSAACSSGATRGRMIWIRVPPPGSDSRSSRPPSRLVTILYEIC